MEKIPTQTFLYLYIFFFQKEKTSNKIFHAKNSLKYD